MSTYRSHPIEVKAYRHDPSAPTDAFIAKMIEDGTAIRGPGGELVITAAGVPTFAVQPGDWLVICHGRMLAVENSAFKVLFDRTA